MPLPTEPIGSIPRPTDLLAAMSAYATGGISRERLHASEDAARRETIASFERIGVHTCPGGDHDCTHSADVGYTGLLLSLFRLNVGRFYIQLCSEPDRPRVLKAAQEHYKPGQVLFIGITDRINPRWETPEEIRDRVLEATRIIPVESLGTTDDCGFSPFADDTSTTRDTAFAKVKSRVEGTLMASNILKV